MLSNIFDLIGRILISLVFLLSGVNKIINYDDTFMWMEDYEVAGNLLIPTIIFEIVAPILIIIGYQVRISAVLLGMFCIATAIIFSSDFSDQMQIVGFLKNLGLAGGFLFLAINGSRKYSIEYKSRR